MTWSLTATGIDISGVEDEFVQDIRNLFVKYASYVSNFWLNTGNQTVTKQESAGTVASSTNAGSPTLSTDPTAPLLHRGGENPAPTATDIVTSAASVEPDPTVDAPMTHRGGENPPPTADANSLPTADPTTPSPTLESRVAAFESRASAMENNISGLLNIVESIAKRVGL